MKTPLLLVAVLAFGCDAPRDASAFESAFRASEQLGHARPTSQDEITATLSPGQPFLFQGRYWIAAGDGVAPAMAAFAPQNVHSIPVVFSGNTLRVIKNGQASLVRLVGARANGSLRFVSQQGSPFAHTFSAVAWSQWGAAASQVQSCTQQVAEERYACLQSTLGDLSYCGATEAEELGDCASGQDTSVAPELGAVPRDPAEFECWLPHGTTVGGVGMPVSYTDALGDAHDCLFFGTIYQESGETGCVTIYDGSLVCDGVPFTLTTDPLGDGTIF